MKKFVLALSAASHAADLPLPVKAPAYAPPPLLSWEGSYVGILGGVANHRANLDPNCTTNIGCETTELTRTGGTIGALLGHNWQQGNFVYGLEGDWTWLGGIKTSTVILKFCSHLKPGGLLFLGHSESIIGMSLPLKQIRPTVYRFEG